MKYVTGSFVKYMVVITLCLIWPVRIFGTMREMQLSFPRIVSITTENFEETNRQLSNPYCGFYLMYGFVPDDYDQNFEEMAVEKLEKDRHELAMIQINLRNYTERPLSETALKNIEDIFVGLETVGKQYIVRFMYDWDGKNLETEPQEAEIIYEHMRQLQDTLKTHSDCIYILQGLFIGNWGELNGTRHLDEMQRLALQLAAVTGDNTYLAVRMPAQWRRITGVAELTTEARLRSSMVRRLSLFNDGIMGNEGDFGTYGVHSKTETGSFGLWNREEELSFQEELCCYVPNGGEVIVDNPWNDFENAKETLKQMHISYLNLDYDQNVLNKWAKSTVTESGCFFGMDGLSYVERHLGYRMLIKDVSMRRNYWSDKLSININLQNVGFAPIYKKQDVSISIRNKVTQEVTVYPVDADVRQLAGGTGADEVLLVNKSVSLKNFRAGEYEVYFSVFDKDSNRYIEFANEQIMQEYGYKIGEFSIADSISLKDVMAGLTTNPKDEDGVTGGDYDTSRGN